MKNLQHKIKTTLLALLLFSINNYSAACDLSSLTLNSIDTLSPTGPYNMNITFCTGGGVSGGYAGADQNTGSYAFLLYGGAEFVSYPNSITSPQTNVNFVPNLLNVDTLIYSGNGWWACLDGCGPLESICKDITLTVNQLPSALFLIGMEGGGNPWASCMGPDMYVYPDPNNIPDPCDISAVYAEAGPNKTVYLGYSPLECTYMTAFASGNFTPPLSYNWSNGATTQSISVCPQSTTTYTVEIIDSNGCFGDDDMTVIVEDIRCGKNNDKVLMCNTKGDTKCEKQNKVASKLSKGWTLGPCDNINFEYSNDSFNSFNDSEELIEVYPTIFNEQLTLNIKDYEDSQINITLFDFQGKIVRQIVNESIKDFYQERIKTSDLKTGNYLMTISIDGEMELSRKLFKIQ